MANNCGFEMRITGPDKATALFFASEVEKMGRVYYADPYDEWGESGYVTVQGDCAWSLAAAFDLNRRGTGCSNTLEAEAARLGVSLEAYSEECGCGFNEHVVIRDGLLSVSECADWESRCLDDLDGDDLGKLREELGFASREELLATAEDGYLSLGGYDWTYPGEEQDARHGAVSQREEALPLEPEPPCRDDLYRRPRHLHLDNFHPDFQCTYLDDSSVDEIWSWREKEELACELAYQLGPDGNAPQEAKGSCAGNPLQCGRLFEHVWPAYWDEGKARSISEIALEGVRSWVDEGGLAFGMAGHVSEAAVAA